MVRNRVGLHLLERLVGFGRDQRGKLLDAPCDGCQAEADVGGELTPVLSMRLVGIALAGQCLWQ